MTVATSRAATVYQALLLLEATAGLRHDLRNRLASVRNASFYLKRKVEGGAATLWSADTRVPRFFEMIDTELASAEDIIASTTPQVLSEPRSPGAIDVTSLVSEVASEIAAPDGVRTIAPEPTPLPVLADPIELRIAFRCLLENAIEAVRTNHAGELVRIVTATTDGVARVSIIDDGPGFVDGPTEQWLKPFATTKSGRMGLGLNIARRVAMRAGGALSLENGVPRGAVVTMSWPSVPSAGEA